MTGRRRLLLAALLAASLLQLASANGTFSTTEECAHVSVCLCLSVSVSMCLSRQKTTHALTPARSIPQPHARACVCVCVCAAGLFPQIEDVAEGKPVSVTSRCGYAEQINSFCDPTDDSVTSSNSCNGNSPLTCDATCPHGSAGPAQFDMLDPATTTYNDQVSFSPDSIGVTAESQVLVLSSSAAFPDAAQAATGMAIAARIKTSQQGRRCVCLTITHTPTWNSMHAHARTRARILSLDFSRPLSTSTSLDLDLSPPHTHTHTRIASVVQLLALKDCVRITNLRAVHTRQRHPG